MRNPAARYGLLALFLAVSLGGGMLVGISNPPGDWYAGLAKPSFNPPDWLFPPAWTLLYILIGIAGWRVWRLRDSGALMIVWIVQMVLNFCWSPVFFGAQQIGAALVVVLALLATILLFIRLAWNRERVAALLFLPYAAWVAFASLLNGAILYLN